MKRNEETADLIRRAAAIAGGVDLLSVELGWHIRAMNRVIDGEKINAYRAAQISEYLGLDVDQAIQSALLDLAHSDRERDFWAARLSHAKIAAGRPQSASRDAFDLRTPAAL